MADTTTAAPAPLKVIDLPNRIITMDETTPILVQQNFEEITYALAKVQKYLNDNVIGATNSADDYEANAITCGPGDPTD
jgi:hypothetical protein